MYNLNVAILFPIYGLVKIFRFCVSCIKRFTGKTKITKHNVQKRFQLSLL